MTVRMLHRQIIIEAIKIIMILYMCVCVIPFILPSGYNKRNIIGKFD